MQDFRLPWRRRIRQRNAVTPRNSSSTVPGCVIARMGETDLESIASLRRTGPPSLQRGYRHSKRRRRWTRRRNCVTLVL
jgi:hypothetical protein